MKRIILFALLTIIGASANQLFAQKNENKVVCFKSDMDCADCEKTITGYLKFEKGVKDLKVDHATNTILVEYKEGKNTDDGFAKAIEKKGYKAEKITKEQYEKIVEQAHKEVHEHGAEVHKKGN
jgi:copper chaperone CopZ